mmetsp:Transcript_8407/g.15783  ORF Transcript_8407/g.15783 Transcript_8407/m.15783 type:complete len:144 (+) Transcript_8407:324-755(+)
MLDTPVGIGGAVVRDSRIGDGTSDGAIDIAGEATACEVTAWEVNACAVKACHTGAGAEEARDSVFVGRMPATEPNRLAPCCCKGGPLGDGRDLAGETQGGTVGFFPPLLLLLLAQKPVGTCETTVGVGDPMRDATSRGGQPIS